MLNILQTKRRELYGDSLVFIEGKKSKKINKFQREKKPRGKAVNFQWITLARGDLDSNRNIYAPPHLARPSMNVYGGEFIAQSHHEMRTNRNSLMVRHQIVVVRRKNNNRPCFLFRSPVLYYPRLCATWFISRIVLHAAAAAPLRANLQTPPPLQTQG
jgi:hypothetical protein